MDDLWQEVQYLDLLEFTLEDGDDRPPAREGLPGSKAVFGHTMRFDLKRGYPLFTTKHVSFQNIAKELKWFLRGDTNIAWLVARNCHIWDAFADANGDIGPLYPKQWRAWEDYQGDTIDQIARLIHGIKTDRYSRRHIVSVWNVADLPDMSLAPCHPFWQMWVSSKGELSCQLYQRSADLLLGCPYNVASYALLTHMVAHVCDLTVGEFIWVGGDCHIYEDHFDQVREQLARTPHPLPTLELRGQTTDIDDFELTDFVLKGYTHHPAIKAPVAVGKLGNR